MVLPITEHMEQQPGVAEASSRELLTGDLGLVVVRALLEGGVGYIVSSWQDRPTPIDAAIDDARDRVLGARGVVLRRLRSLSMLEPIIASPSGGITAAPPRGAVVFSGRRGLRPALEEFVRVDVPGAVVGFTFDEDALRIDDAIVIDPAPTAAGLVDAIDAGFAASVAAGRPALIVVRERSMGMRGTIHHRPDVSPVDAANADVLARGEHRMSIAAALEHAGLIVASRGTHQGGAQRAIVVNGPMRVAVERALAHVAEQLAAVPTMVRVDDVAIVSSHVVGFVPDPAGPIGSLLAGVHDACVLGPRADRLADRLRAALNTPVSIAHGIDPGTVRGEQLVALVATWVLEGVDALEDPAREALAGLIDGAVHRAKLVPGTRLPRRGEVLHRTVSPVVAAGLALSQGVIGVPGRADAAFPTYHTDTGVPLTVVPASVFAAHGAASAAPGSGAGVFLVTGQGAGLVEAAGAAGASIEYVDGSSPRAIGVAIGAACRSPRVASHVIVVSDVQRVVAPRNVTFGMDPELVGTDRIATSAVPTAATVLVQLDDELAAGPTVLARDLPAAHAALDQVRQLSPATWELRRRDASGRAGRMVWNLRRRMVRTIAGVDL